MHLSSVKVIFFIDFSKKFIQRQTVTHKVYYEKILIKKKRKLRTKTFC